MIRRYDSLVIGSGIAGLYTALSLARLGTVGLVTKAALEEGNTRYAQGGIAAVTSDDDDVDLHIDDTLVAGAGLCDRAAVEVLCSEGPNRIRELLSIGVDFDHDSNGLARGREAAHSRARVLHAGGDATGARIEAALASSVRRHDRIRLYESSFVTELEQRDGVVLGARLLDGSVLHASATVLASGGAGQLYLHTTNPAVATGDGVAAAFRAGATVADAEFFQFHPTAIAMPGTFLLSEAVRGEGAVLRNQEGKRFVDELAPRDVVARAIAREMSAQDGVPVRLDATHMDARFLAERFPSIHAACLRHGFDISSDLVPVTPAAHYWMGGIATDLCGRTSLENLFACGEVANTGVHGANRLASNSLLEGLVFGARIVTHLEGRAEHSSQERQSSSPEHSELTVPSRALTKSSVDATTPELSWLRQLMWDHVGLERDEHGLELAAKQLAAWRAPASPCNREDYELTNLLTIARLVVRAASDRQESRGAHFRTDHPTTEDRWIRRLAYTTC